MTLRRSALTRNQLADICKTPEAIKAFEDLLKSVGETIPDNLELLEVAAQANAMLSEMRSATAALRREIEELRIDIASMRRIQRQASLDESQIIMPRMPDVGQTERRIADLEAQPLRQLNIAALERRLADLETKTG